MTMFYFWVIVDSKIGFIYTLNRLTVRTDTGRLMNDKEKLLPKLYVSCDNFSVRGKTIPISMVAHDKLILVYGRLHYVINWYSMTNLPHESDFFSFSFFLPRDYYFMNNWFVVFGRRLLCTYAHILYPNV